MRLIDADDAIYDLEIVLPAEYYNKVVRAISRVETIDAVPVVRCKDCKHSLKDDLFRTRWCQKPGQYKEVKDGFFCAYGERKDDAIN